MYQIDKAHIVPYEPSQMYRLVNDIASYPDFLPWCAKTVVYDASETQMDAEMTMQKGFASQSFRTLNELVPNESITLRLKEGPFRHLEGSWKFEGVNGGTRISLNMSFEFSNPLIGNMMGPVLARIVGSLVDAFEKRANEVYGA